MSFAWQWSSIIDKGTCPTCFDMDGKTASSPQGFRVRPPVHMRCRCLLLLIWAWFGGHRSAGSIAPDALVLTEDDTRGFVHSAIRRAAAPARIGVAAMRSGLSAAFLHGRKNARDAGRLALTQEVGKLRPRLDASPLLRAKYDRSDGRKARRAATGLSMWWLVAVGAIMVKRHVDRDRAKELATIALRKRAEGSIITESADAFNDERAKAAPELRRLKERT